MSKKKSGKKAAQDLKALDARLEKVEGKAQRWKKKVKQLEEEAREMGEQLDSLRHRVEAALSASAVSPPGISARDFSDEEHLAGAPLGSVAEPPTLTRDSLAVPETGEVTQATGVALAPAVELDVLEEAVAESTVSAEGEAAASAPTGTPDETWTLTALQVTANERGLVDYAGLSKAELLRLLAE